MEEVSAKKLCVRDLSVLEPSALANLPDVMDGVQIKEPQTESIEASRSPILQEVENAGLGTPSLKNIVILNAMMLMESSSSESELEEEVIIRKKLQISNEIYPDRVIYLYERNPRNSVKYYVEETVPTYTEKEFRSHFRISKDLFENLSQRLLQWNGYKNLRADKRLSEKVYLLVFLWFAGHEACSFRDLSDRFNLSLYTISTIIHRVSMFISSLSPEIIKWPNETKKLESSQFYDEKCFFSKAIGCIDGTHITIDPPKKGKDEYIDRKGNTTICMQGICDENKKFINIFVGYPGSCHDSWVLKNSPIYEKLPSYCGDYYLLGDSAYPCNKYLVTPYKDNGRLQELKNFLRLS